MSEPRTGVWFLGACGAVATTAAAGARALAAGLAEPTGLVTELADFADLDLVLFDRLVFGGHEARDTTPLASARAIAAVGGSIPAHLVETLESELAALAPNIRPAPVLDTSRAIRDLPGARVPCPASAREVVARVTRDIREFVAKHDLARAVVVNVASAESSRPRQAAEAGSLERLESFLDRAAADDLSPGLLYAYAALRAGCPFVNFTTAAGTELPALSELALEMGLPHAGRDGKTGETLLKTTLAPMFLARHLRVLSWEGHNILGGGDGQVLSDETNRAAKTRSKDRALHSLFGARPPHTGVRIDYVPSLGDWKTAWDFVHFEGFLGVRMILQLLWQGCDSALAAPLVLDLVRLADLAHRRGEAGPMAHTACFFKDPIASGEHDFHRQHDALARYVHGRVTV
ncbi:MAG: inositol-3-phosphate synthase [Planctomycetes bacterium]|nr:inositol-3-phosphate synthase [Planctomycetota bacterium]